MLSRAYDVKEGQLFYDIDGGELTVVQGDEPYTGYIVIPKSVEVDGQQLSVTAIGQKAFNACLSLSGVKLPGTLRTIGQQAFASCPRLLSIGLAEGLQTIGDAAFYGCRSLTEITIPASVTSIGDEAFVACSSLKAISVAQDNSNYSSLSGVLFSKDRLTLLAYPAGCDDIYSIPSGITTIGPWAFCHCANLEQVSLPSTVRRIGQASFYGCKKLSAIRLPAGLSAIGLWAFSECGSLRQVTPPASLEELGEGAFSFCEAMEGIYVEAGNSRFKSVDGVLLTADGTRVVAFPGGREGSYRLPSTVDSIGLQAFYGSNKLRSVTLPENLSRVASNPFVFCDGLEEILVDHANGSLSSRDGVLLSHDCTQLLYYPNARSGHYLMPEGITAIGHGSFLRSEGLSQLSLPATLTEIDPWTFLDCTVLREISLPHSIAAIGREAFAGCRNLQQVVCGGTPPEGSNFLTEQQATARLLVPIGQKAAYMGSTGWGGFVNAEEYGLQSHALTIEQGCRQTLTVGQTGSLMLAANELQLTFPEGIAIATDEQGNYIVAQTTGDGSPSCRKLSDNSYAISLSPAAPTTTDLLTIALEAAADCPTGAHTIALDKATLSYKADAVGGVALQLATLLPIEVTASTDIDTINHSGKTPDSTIYNLQGVAVGRNKHDYELLPTGVYIVNGKKVVKQ